MQRTVGVIEKHVAICLGYHSAKTVQHACTSIDALEQMRRYLSVACTLPSHSPLTIILS